FIWFADLAAEKFHNSEESLSEGDRERERGMKTLCESNARARKVSVGVIRYPCRFANAPNKSRQTDSRGKGEFRRRSLKLKKPAGIALPRCETPQDICFWLVRPESSCFPSKGFTNVLENFRHCIRKCGGFGQYLRDGKVDRLPVLRALAFSYIVVCFQNIRALALLIAVQHPAREHDNPHAVVSRVNRFALPVVIAKQLLVDFR